MREDSVIRLWILQAYKDLFPSAVEPLASGAEGWGSGAVRQVIIFH